DDDGLDGGWAGLSAGDARACWRICSRVAATAATAALAVSLGLGRGLFWSGDSFRLRLQKPVKVNHDVAHFGIVHRGLRLSAPGFFGSRKAVIDSDQVDRIEVEV